MKNIVGFFILLLLCALFGIFADANLIGSIMFGCACGFIFHLLEHYGR